jgi:hypothetical protein
MSGGSSFAYRRKIKETTSYFSSFIDEIINPKSFYSSS